MNIAPKILSINSSSSSISCKNLICEFSPQKSSSVISSKKCEESNLGDKRYIRTEKIRNRSETSYKEKKIKR